MVRSQAETLARAITALAAEDALTAQRIHRHVPILACLPDDTVDVALNGKKEDDVNVSDLTLRKSKGTGVCGSYSGASIHLDNVSVENSGNNGVFVSGSKRNTMKKTPLSFNWHAKHWAHRLPLLPC